MSKRYRAGLVVGKFSPLHDGHRWLLDTAQEACEQLIIISYSRPEFPGCTAELRQRWLADAYPAAERCVVDAATWARICQGQPEAPRMPMNDAPDQEQRAFCAWLLTRYLRRSVDAVFTSEDYGPGFADYLSASQGSRVMHECLGPQRRQLPVSGSDLRQQLAAGAACTHLNKSIGDDVQCQRVALIGAESSGKSTLAAWLAKQLDLPLVEEYGRVRWVQRDGQLEREDLLAIARVQSAAEDEAVNLARRRGKSAVICDTTPLTTLLYYRAMFPNEPVPDELLAWAERPYHQWWFCHADFPLVQDGTRQDETFRQAQQQHYLTETRARGLTLKHLHGPLLARQQRLMTDFAPLAKTRQHHPMVDAR
ncbi:MAG: AAA family ATPase [Marinobacter sp.]|nr:AAA family ATPase [Marinobacter sp.]